jgi:hypothetical protein
MELAHGRALASKSGYSRVNLEQIIVEKVPQTIADEVTQGINALIRRDDRFKDWNAPEVLNLRRRIDQLQKAQAQQAFIARGQLAAICGNVEQVRESYRKALHLPDLETTKHEFWGAFGNVGLHQEARELGKWLLEPRRGFFQRIWKRALSRGQVFGVLERLAEASRMYPEMQDDFSPVERAASVMRERKLRDEDVVAIFDLMGEIQRSHGIMFAGQLVSILRVLRPSEDPAYLYFSIPLDTTVAEVRAMNRELAARVVEKLPHGVFPEGLVTSFTKAIAADHRAAA